MLSWARVLYLQGRLVEPLAAFCLEALLIRSVYLVSPKNHICALFGFVGGCGGAFGGLAAFRGILGICRAHLPFGVLSFRHFWGAFVGSFFFWWAAWGLLGLVVAFRGFSGLRRGAVVWGLPFWGFR